MLNIDTVLSMLMLGRQVRFLTWRREDLELLILIYPWEAAQPSRLYTLSTPLADPLCFSSYMRDLRAEMRPQRSPFACHYTRLSVKLTFGLILTTMRLSLAMGLT